jgi:uncharacterized protein YcbX
MQSARLRPADTGVQGIVGDRAYALRDLNGRFATSKKWPTMAGPVQMGPTLRYVMTSHCQADLMDEDSPRSIRP